MFQNKNCVSCCGSFPICLVSLRFKRDGLGRQQVIVTWFVLMLQDMMVFATDITRMRTPMCRRNFKWQPPKSNPPVKKCDMDDSIGNSERVAGLRVQ